MVWLASFYLSGVLSTVSRDFGDEAHFIEGRRFFQFTFPTSRLFSSSTQFREGRAEKRGDF